jgi:hypothetical protein
MTAVLLCFLEFLGFRNLLLLCRPERQFVIFNTTTVVLKEKPKKLESISLAQGSKYKNKLACHFIILLGALISKIWPAVWPLAGRYFEPCWLV